MKLIRAELKKYFSSFPAAILIAAVISVSALVSVIAARGESDGRAEARAFEEYVSDTEAAEEYLASLVSLINGDTEEPAVPRTWSDRTDDYIILSRAAERAKALAGHETLALRRANDAGRRAEDLAAMGYDPDGFTVRSEEKYKESFLRVSGRVNTGSGYVYGWGTFFGNEYLIVPVMILAVFSASFIFVNDRAAGYDRITRTAKRGRASAGVAKSAALAAVVFVGSLAVSATSLAAMCAVCGLSDPTAPVQALPGYEFVPILCSLALFAVIRSLLSALSACVFAFICSLLCCLLPAYLFSVPAGSAMTALLFAAFYGKQSAAVPAGVFFNPAALADGNGISKLPRFVNLLDNPVGLLPLALLLGICEIVLLAAGSVILYAFPLVLPSVKVRSEKKKDAVGGTAEIRTHALRPGAYETVKTPVSVTLAILVVCLAASAAVVFSTSGSMSRYDEALYYTYVEKLSGLGADERADYAAGERARIDSALSGFDEVAERFESGEITRDEYTRALNAYYDAKAEDAVFLKVEKYLAYTRLQSLERGVDIAPVYDTGIGIYAGGGTDLFAAAVICILLSNVWAVEYSGENGGFSRILSASRHGRKKAAALKLAAGSAFGAAVAVSFRIVRLTVLRHLYLFPSRSAPLCALRDFSRFSTGATVGGWIAADLALSAVFGLLSAVFVCVISYVFKKFLLSLTLSATLFALSEFLSAKLGPAVGFTSLSHPASIVSGFLQDKPVTGIILTTAVHLLFAGIAAAVSFVSLRRSRIRKPKG